MKLIHQGTIILVVSLILAPYTRAQLQSFATTNDNSENNPSIIRENENNSDVISFSYQEALILGLVEGITEFLPISSTGHLIITNKLLGLNVEQPLKNQTNNYILRKPSSKNSCP